MKIMSYDHDPDVVRWGLDTLFNSCTISNAGSSSSVTKYQIDESQVGYVAEGYNETACSDNVENDAVIAHALQEEFSRLAAAEASGIHNPAEESLLQQEWHQYNNDVKVEDCCGNGCEKVAGHSGEKRYEESYEIPSSSLYSSAVENSDGTEDPAEFFSIEDESDIDGEVGKRLNQMVPVPHVPKINGDLPSEEEQISDHQRLLERLKVYDLAENKVEGDGNCQFRALSDQLYRSPDHHKFVRAQVIKQLKSYPERYEGYVLMAYSDYLNKMTKSGEWGDHVTLQAAADAYGVRIFVLTSFKDTCYIEILPLAMISERIIYLSFWAEVHYNSVYPEGERVIFEAKKKRKWWHF